MIDIKFLLTLPNWIMVTLSVSVFILSISLYYNKKSRLDRNFSVFSGECVAVIQAVESVLKIGVQKVTIFTDSRSVVDIISSSRINRDGNYTLFLS